jgi:hypothetical protein
LVKLSISYNEQTLSTSIKHSDQYQMGNVHLKLVDYSLIKNHSSIPIDFQLPTVEKRTSIVDSFNFNGYVVFCLFFFKLPIIFLDILTSGLINYMNLYHGVRNHKIWFKSISSVNINSQDKIIIKQTFGINWTIPACYFMNTISINVFIIIWNYIKGRKLQL